VSLSDQTLRVSLAVDYMHLVYINSQTLRVSLARISQSFPRRGSSLCQRTANGPFLHHRQTICPVGTPSPNRATTNLSANWTRLDSNWSKLREAEFIWVKIMTSLMGVWKKRCFPFEHYLTPMCLHPFCRICARFVHCPALPANNCP
jgi:hypothetical protein